MSFPNPDHRQSPMVTTMTAMNSSTFSRSSTPAHLSIKKTLFDISQSAQKIQDNLSLSSSLVFDENNDNFNLSTIPDDENNQPFDSKEPQSQSSQPQGWRLLYSISSESEQLAERIVPVTSGNLALSLDDDNHNLNHTNTNINNNNNNNSSQTMKNLSSEDTLERIRDPAINGSSFIPNYKEEDDNNEFSPPSQEDLSILVSEREIVVRFIEEEALTDERKAQNTSQQPSSPKATSSPVPLPLALLQQSEGPVIQEVSAEIDLSEEDCQRLQRQKEERESQELIWELMRQEQMELYQMQLQYMQTQVEGLSEEDMRAIQETMQENNQMFQTMQTYSQQGEAVIEVEEEDGEGGEEELDEEEEEEEEWDYDRLLALGQALGDVKTERWRMRSKQVIESLPCMSYQDIIASTNAAVQGDVHQQKRLKTSNSSSPSGGIASPSNHGTIASRSGSSSSSTFFKDYRCVVCMEDFEGSEICRVLPCTHYFHIDCTAGWLADHNSCPTCKKKVVASPEK